MTTPEQHNKYLGISHLINGGLILLMMIAMLGFMTAMLASTPGPGAPPAGVLAFMWVFIGGMYSLMSIPSMVAGYALLKRKTWARTAAIVGGVTAAMSFPIGTAVCAYTFWFLFSEPGKLLYDQQRYSLPQMPGGFPLSGQQQRDNQYLPPRTPPDWR